MALSSRRIAQCAALITTTLIVGVFAALDFTIEFVGLPRSIWWSIVFWAVWVYIYHACLSGVQAARLQQKERRVHGRRSGLDGRVD